MSTLQASARSRASRRSGTLLRSVIIFQNCLRDTRRCSRIMRAVRTGGKWNRPATSTKLSPCCHDQAIFFACSFSVEPLRRIADDALCVNHEEQFLIVAEVLREKVDILGCLEVLEDSRVFTELHKSTSKGFVGE